MSDVRGTGSAVVSTTVVGLQGRHVSATMPLTGQVLMFDGTQWIPGTITGGTTPPPTGGAGAPITGGGGGAIAGGGGGVVTGGGTGTAAATGAGSPVTGGSTAPLTGGGGAPLTGGQEATLVARISELEARLAALEGKRE